MPSHCRGWRAVEVTGQGEDGKASQNPEQQSLPSEGLFILILFLTTVKIFQCPFLVLYYDEDLLDFLPKLEFWGTYQGFAQ